MKSEQKFVIKTSSIRLKNNLFTISKNLSNVDSLLNTNFTFEQGRMITQPYLINSNSNKNKNKFYSTNYNGIKLKCPLLTECNEVEPNDLRKDSPPHVPFDLKQIKTSGEGATKNYYEHYHKIERIIEENKYNNIPNSLVTNMHLQSTQNCLLPCKLGLIKERGSEKHLKIPNMRYGNDYMKVLVQGLKDCRQITSFDFQGNRISQKTSSDFFQQIAKSGKNINLADNDIGTEGVDTFCKTLIEKESRIETLDLENNKLTLKNTLKLMNTLASLGQKNIIRILNISKNNINNQAALSIVPFIENSPYLNELYLHWNLIKSSAAAKIFKVLATNDSLKVFDISSNSIGIKSQASCIKEICEFFENNKEMIHIDLSNNQFNYTDTIQLGLSLEKNTTIYGIHYFGNAGYIDHLGFLIPMQIPDQELTENGIKNKIQSVNFNFQKRSRNYRDTLKDCCWICEGWNEIILKSKPETRISLVDDPNFIHFSHEDYQNIYLPKSLMDNFEFRRMVPPGQLNFFFTNDFNSYSALNYHSIRNGSSTININLFDKPQIVCLEKLNNLNIETNKQVISDRYAAQILTIPRQKDPIYILPIQKKVKKIWSFPISLFKDWRRDDDALLANCFEVDWAGCRIPKLVKNEEDLGNLKRFMKSIYSSLRQTYKYYSSQSPVGDVWAIQSQVYMQILIAIELQEQIQQDIIVHSSRNLESLKNVIQLTEIDSIRSIDDTNRKVEKLKKTLIKQQDLDLKFISTISGAEKGNFRKPDRGLVRHQLLELLVRIVEEKYIKTAVAKSFTEGMQMFWEDHLMKEFTTHDLQEWRNTRYWNEQCDYCLKHYKQIIDHVFNKYSVKKVKPGQKKFVCLQEFEDLCSNAGLLELKHFGGSFSQQAYNFSMMTQVNELSLDRIFEMSFVEFLEGISRVAEEACLSDKWNESQTEYDLHQEQQKGLHIKLENLIIQFYDNVCDESFRFNNKRPTKSFFSMQNDD